MQQIFYVWFDFVALSAGANLTNIFNTPQTVYANLCTLVVANDIDISTRYLYLCKYSIPVTFKNNSIYYCETEFIYYCYFLCKAVLFTNMNNDSNN